MRKRVIMASDHAGFDLKENIKSYLEKKGYSIKDIGTYSKERCDYPKLSASLAQEVSLAKYKRGILICKSGIGNSIVANRFPGVRAALCYNMKAAILSRQHNDSNVLVLGAAFVDGALAKRIASAWLDTDFEGGRHKRRLEQIRDIERKIKDSRS